MTQRARTKSGLHHTGTARVAERGTLRNLAFTGKLVLLVALPWLLAPVARLKCTCTAFHACALQIALETAQFLPDASPLSSILQACALALHHLEFSVYVRHGHLEFDDSSMHVNQLLRGRHLIIGSNRVNRSSCRHSDIQLEPTHLRRKECKW